MNITLNGRKCTISGVFVIRDLVREHKLNPDQVVVEHNKTVVPKDAYATTTVNEGDIIEIVRFVGGG